jgi:integrase
VNRAVVNFDEALRPLLRLYGKTRAIDFGPLRLKAIRQEMIDAGRARTNINRHMVRVRGVFKWAVENEMIPSSIFHGLMAVSGLRRGRCAAKESAPVRPVPVEHVNATLPHVSPQVAAMIQLQLLTGMRPGEVVLMRGQDLDTTGKLWVYRPHRHKTQIHGHAREIYIGPKGQEIIRPFLKTDLAAYLFSPADAEAYRRELLHAQRTTPMSCGNKPGSNRRRKPKRVPGERYDVAAFYLAVRRGCDRAFPPSADLGDDSAALKTWRKEHRWHPHQLRHTAATELRKSYGLEAAQVILGHRTLTVTQVYAEKNAAEAQRIMGAIG